MKQRFIVAMLAAAALAITAGCANLLSPGYAKNQTITIHTVVYGTVAGTEENGEELVVRLEDGKTILVEQPGKQGFKRGQRVRVITGPEGSQLEHAPARS
jgi:outer membrane lipoprotein SlyB